MVGASSAWPQRPQRPGEAPVATTPPGIWGKRPLPALPARPRPDWEDDDSDEAPAAAKAELKLDLQFHEYLNDRVHVGTAFQNEVAANLGTSPARIRIHAVEKAEGSNATVFVFEPDILSGCQHRRLRSVLDPRERRGGRSAPPEASGSRRGAGDRGQRVSRDPLTRASR